MNKYISLGSFQTITIIFPQCTWLYHQCYWMNITTKLYLFFFAIQWQQTIYKWQYPHWLHFYHLPNTQDPIVHLKLDVLKLQQPNWRTNYSKLVVITVHMASGIWLSIIIFQNSLCKPLLVNTGCSTGIIPNTVWM